MSPRLGPLSRLAWRHYLLHPWQAGLALLGVALGVAVLISIEAANGSALAAFRLSTEALTGRATHQIIGSSNGVPEELFRRLRLEASIRPSTPVVEGRVELMASPSDPRTEEPGESGLFLRLLGIDPFTEPDFRSYLGPSTLPDLDLAGFLTVPGSVVLERQAAASLGLQVGDPFMIRAAQRNVELRVLDLVTVDDEAARQGLSDLLIADLATAQEVLQLAGTLTRIDLMMSRLEESERLETIRSLLPPGVRVESADSRSESAETMTRSFRQNLRALSLLALFCGAFLIYNTMTFSVLQRRHVLGTLRALGATRGQILSAILLEASLVGAAGTGVGIPAGLALARGILGQITQTINDHYFVLTVSRLEVSAIVLVAAAALGLGASILGALMPALEAVRAAPRASLQRSEIEAVAHRAVPRVSSCLDL